MTVDLCMIYMLMLASMTLTLRVTEGRHSKKFSVELSRQLSKQISIELATTYGRLFSFLLHDLAF